MDREYPFQRIFTGTTREMQEKKKGLISPQEDPRMVNWA